MRREGPVTLSPELSRAGAIAHLARLFAEAGLASPDLDSRLLVEEAVGPDPGGRVASGSRPLGQAAGPLSRLAERRLGGEPVQRLLGVWEFWSLPFRLAPATLIPRPDTETLVEAALALMPDRQAPWRLLDLGTGSGCILVALLHERPAAWGLGLDRSPEAAWTARDNARRNGVDGRAAFAVSDWAAAVDARFDLVVSNPPYIPAADIAGLAPEVRDHDPRAALDGGVDGLDAHRAILADAGRLLAEGGALVLEIGFDQGEAVRALGREHGWRSVETRRDLGGHERAVTLRRAG